MKILKVELTNAECKSILTDAIETHAIDYWALEYGLIEVWRDDDLNITKAIIEADNARGKRVKYTVTPNTIRQGVNNLLSGKVCVHDRIIQQIVTDDNDSDSCDAILQAALFGEIIYG